MATRTKIRTNKRKAKRQSQNPTSKTSPIMRDKLTRAMQGKSQSEIARLTGIDQARISRIMKGRGEPYARELFAIAQACGASLDYLLDDSKTEPDPPLTEWENRILWLLRNFAVNPEIVASLVVQELITSGRIPNHLRSIGLPAKPTTKPGA
jgi:transcriptional regulator with XRE-family HTH domain